MTVDENYPAKQRSRAVGICAPNVNRNSTSSGPKSSIIGMFLSVYLHICPYSYFVSEDGPRTALSDPAQPPIHYNLKERSIQPAFSEEYSHHSQDFYDYNLAGMQYRDIMLGAL